MEMSRLLAASSLATLLSCADPESGVAVDPIVLADDCQAITDGGPCRTIKVKLTNPP